MQRMHYTQFQANNIRQRSLKSCQNRQHNILTKSTAKNINECLKCLTSPYPISQNSRLVNLPSYSPVILALMLFSGGEENVSCYSIDLMEYKQIHSETLKSIVVACASKRSSPIGHVWNESYTIRLNNTYRRNRWSTVSKAVYWGPIKRRLNAVDGANKVIWIDSICLFEDIISVNWNKNENVVRQFWFNDMVQLNYTAVHCSI